MVSPKDEVKPWINSDLKSLLKQRQRLFLLVKRGIVVQNEYRIFRNFVNNKLKQSKANYYKRAFDGVKTNVKKTWKLLNNIIRPNKGQSKAEISKIISDNITYTDSKEICDLFNTFFSSIGDHIQSSIPGTSINNSTINILNHSSSFFFNPVSTIIIKKIISNFKNKSSSISTYSVRTLKHISDIISPILSMLVNRSILSGHFPSYLKLARVIPIFKSGNHHSLDNFRGISLLHVISKIFEKVSFDQLYNYFDHFDLFSNAQYGFRKRLSTKKALIDATQYIYNNLDKGETVISFFLDFKKAFDCVDHVILLNKLSSYGVRGVALQWFKSYLSNRQQYVFLNGKSSELREVRCGVPQGSILGPLLFLVFINDFPKCSNFFKFNLFADDSTLSCSFKDSSPENIHYILSNEIELINSWLLLNKIAINSEKSNFIVFSYRKNISISPVPFGNCFINQTSNTKFLGIIIDKNLKFVSHIEFLCKKVSKTVGILHRVKEFLPSVILKTIYNTLVYPYLNYGIETWYGAPQYARDSVNVLQKKAIRAINDLPYNAHTSEYFKSGRVLKLLDIYKFNITSQIFTSIAFPDQLSPFLMPHSGVHSYITRNHNQIIVPFFRRSTSQSSFLYQSITEYNSLPNELKNVDSLGRFRWNLIDFYCSKY